MAYDTNDRNMFARLENRSGYGNTYDNHVLNPFVNFNNSRNEQSLHDILVAESISMRGVECIYIKRDSQNVDLVFGEDPRSRFTEYYKIAAYVESFEGWDGEQDWMTKFGYTVDDEMNIAINPNLFRHQANGTDPKEGDLLYFPLAKSLFELTWVEREDPWYELGSLPIRKIKLNKFIYAGEEIDLDPNQAVNDVDGSGIFELIGGAADTDDLDKVNAINGRYDTDITQGDEKVQVDNEASRFLQDHAEFPPDGPLQTPIPTPPSSTTLDTNLDDLDF